MTQLQTALVFISLGLPALFGSAANCAEQTVRIDFGSSQTRSKAPWNNVDQPGDVGLVALACQDATGVVTSLAIRQTNPWAGYNLLGVKSQRDWPDSVGSDSFYLESAVDDRACLQLEGLQPGGDYRLTLFASRVGGSDRRVGRYEIGEQSQTLDAHNNTKQRLVFEKVVADADGMLTLEVSCAPDSKYAYLGALEITGEFPAAESYLQPADDLAGPPLVSAKAWAIADGATGEILWSENDAQVRAMASTTKMMTALLVIELCAAVPDRWNDLVPISAKADKTPGSTASLNAGESLAAKDLLYGLLLPSGNDAAVALAEHFGRYLPAILGEPVTARSEVAPDLSAEEAMRRFVAAMNRRAADLSMAETVYLDPHGNSANRSSARDLVSLAWEAMQNESFRGYVKTRQHRCDVITGSQGTRKQTWKNTNQLLTIEGFDGVKTGTTDTAGECLVSSGVRDGDRLLVVTLGSSKDSRFLDTRNLFRWAWSQRQLSASSPARPK